MAAPSHRRRLAVGILACVLGLLPSGAGAGERRELIVWGVAGNAQLKAACRRFEAERPGWTVVTSSGAGTGHMDPQKLMCGIAGGSPPDLLYQGRFSISELVVLGAFEPLDDYVRQSMADQAYATAARDALRSGQSRKAADALSALIARLEQLGPSRQLSLASALLKAAQAGQVGTDQLAQADELVALCQGVDQRTFYAACWDEASCSRGEQRRVYGIPNSADSRALYYNEDLLERAGLVDEAGKARPPADWDELAEYAVRLTERDAEGRITCLGFAPNYGNSWLYIYGWLNGGRFMSEDGRRCTLDSPPIVDALAYMVRVYDLLGGIEEVESFQSTFQGADLDPFLSDKVAMKIDGNWFLNTITQYRPKMRFRVVPAPAPKGCKSLTWSGGFSWAIPAKARRPRMAFELIRFLVTDRMWEFQNRVFARAATGRGGSFLPGMAPQPHVNRMMFEKLVRPNPDISDRAKEGVLLFDELMAVSLYRPVTPVGHLLWNEHVRAYERAVRHEASPADALAESCRKVQRQLDPIIHKVTYPEVNWMVPIAAVVILLLIAAAVIYLCKGRRALLRQMAAPEARAGYLFLTPWLVGFIVLTAGPIVLSVVYSFCRYDVLHPPQFVGWQNYRTLLTDDPLFWKSLANTAFMMLGVPLGMAVGLGVAMLLNAKVRGMQIYRTIFYLPAIVPAVASAILWVWVLNPEIGLVNATLRMLGVSDPPKWLQSPSWWTGSKSAIILMGLWSAGAGMIIWLGGLKGIPQQLYEAAEIDGASAWKRFRHITLPMLSPYIFFNLVMGMIGTLQIFTQAFIMTQGGPNDSTLFYAYYLFNNAFRYFRMGYASALAWILFLIILVLTLIQMKLARRWVHYEVE
ncbi:extracellular solute-binding protein [bacterium]|nr:extracellular solute-binding protein [bacterium]